MGGGGKLNKDGPPAAKNQPPDCNKGKLRVSLLDDTIATFEVESKSLGLDLYKKVNRHLNLEEAEFFGLQISCTEGIAKENENWLDPMKPINKQTKDVLKVLFKFRVMFYTPEPNTLLEYTRYLFTLQVRRDLLDGRLHCSTETGALMASYIVQGELGDYDPRNHKDGYLTGFQFVPNQTEEVEHMIVNNHKSHKGDSAVDADQKMLEIARKLDMYGITLYPALDADNTELDLAVYHMGILVFLNRMKINTFSWGLIRKLSFKKRRFLIKFRPTGTVDGNVVSFNLKSRNAAKCFWKVCLNHHTFFRQKSVRPRTNSKVSFKRGSSYRYSGRTRKEIASTVKCRSPDLSRENNLESANTSPGPSLPHDPTTSFDASKYSQQTSEDGSFSICSGHDEEQSKPNVITMKHKDSVDNIAKEDVAVMNNSPSLESSPSITQSLNSTSSVSQLNENIPPDYNLEFDVSSFSIGQRPIQKQAVPYEELMHEKDPPPYHPPPPSWKRDHSLLTHDEEEQGSETEDDDGHQQNISERTEADEETEAQLREKVKALYLQNYSHHAVYDSDSDASAMTIDEEESAFEDDTSVPHSASSSVSSMHKKEACLKDLHKFITTGKVYNIAKEILLTERTYVKDLEVLTVSFRSVIEKDGLVPESLVKLLYDNIDPLYDFHCSLLAELEERLSLWESLTTAESCRDDVQRIGDIMQKNMRQIKLYISYVHKHSAVLMALEAQTKSCKQFEQAYKEFEMLKVCYLSLNSFLLKPVQRLLYYRNMLAYLSLEYGTSHVDSIDVKVAYEEVSKVCTQLDENIRQLENTHKLVELERDLVGVEGLVHPGRVFIREGCLHKICRKGPQPRMFFLFSDILLYTSQGVTAANQFKARSQVPLWAIKVDEGGVEWHGLYAFTISVVGGNSFVVAASSPSERQKWIDDLQQAIHIDIQRNICTICNAKKSEYILKVGQESKCPACKLELTNLVMIPSDKRFGHWQFIYPPPPSIRQSTPEVESDDDEGTFQVNDQCTTFERRHAHSRTISTRRVCWHRNTSISMHDYTHSIQNSLSGVLLRKYKNSSKWQKLWVVFTNFCLFFFKSYEDEAPIASLPLLGYTASRLTENGVSEENTFKLQFKTHVYYFRAENEHTFQRWMEVVGSATNASSMKQARNQILNK